MPLHGLLCADGAALAPAAPGPRTEPAACYRGVPLQESLEAALSKNEALKRELQASQAALQASATGAGGATCDGVGHAWAAAAALVGRHMPPAPGSASSSLTPSPLSSRQAQQSEAAAATAAHEQEAARLRGELEAAGKRATQLETERDAARVRGCLLPAPVPAQALPAAAAFRGGVAGFQTGLAAGLG